jgi:hypothetical protein
LPVPIGEPFLVPGSILLVPCSTHKEHFTQRVLHGNQKGFSCGDGRRTLLEPFFLNVVWQPLESHWWPHCTVPAPVQWLVIV